MTLHAPLPKKKDVHESIKVDICIIASSFFVFYIFQSFKKHANFPIDSAKKSPMADSLPVLIGFLRGGGDSPNLP